MTVYPILLANLGLNDLFMDALRAVFTFQTNFFNNRPRDMKIRFNM